MKNKNLPLGMAVGNMMHDIFRLLRKRTNEASGVKLTIEQLGLLHAICMKNGDVVQQDLANILGKDKSTILRFIDSLEEKELVQRIVDTNDRRKNCLVASEKGTKIMQLFLSIESVLMGELLKDISAQELDTFYKVVNTVHSNSKRL